MDVLHREDSLNDVTDFYPNLCVSLTKAKTHQQTWGQTTSCYDDGGHYQYRGPNIDIQWKAIVGFK